MRLLIGSGSFLIFFLFCGFVYQNFYTKTSKIQKMGCKKVKTGNCGCRKSCVILNKEI